MAAVGVDRIGIEEMAVLVESEQATLLLLGFDVGPTLYAGEWWHIPHGALDTGRYVRASAEQSAEFAGMKADLDAADEHLAQVLAEAYEDDSPAAGADPASDGVER